MFYEGLGKRFCSPQCGNDFRRAPQPDKPLPLNPDETVHVNIDDREGGSVYVEASRAIKNHEELLERAGVDETKWRIERVPIRTWSVPLKIDDEIHVAQMYYVAVSLKPRLAESWDFKPLEIIVKRPSTKPPRSGGFFTSVHYGDLHYPYQDDDALRVLYQVLDDVRPDLVVCHGDLLDCEQISRFPKDPYNRTPLHEEIRMGAEHLGEVTAITPHADHWLLEGNHEERLRRTLWSMGEDRVGGELVQLKGMRETLSWENQLGLGSLGWEFTPYPQHMLLFDRIILAHGKTVRRHSAYSAKAEHDLYAKSGMSGHTHRMGSYYHSAYDGQVQAWHELGLLGRIRSDYTGTPPNWQQGFAVVTWTQDRSRYGVEHISIHEGSAFFRGRQYGGLAEAKREAA